MDFIDVRHFRDALSKHRSTIHNGLAPHFTDVLDDLRPSIDESTLQSLRVNDSAIAAVLGLIEFTDNKQVLFEFLKSLDNRVKELRRLFLSDEVWQPGKILCYHNSNVQVALLTTTTNKQQQQQTN